MQTTIWQDKKLIIWSIAAVILLMLMWLPGVFLPFWQDDYHSLYAASLPEALSDPWYQAFFHKIQAIFWRPLSKDLYWHFIVKYLDGSELGAHYLNYIIFLLSILAVAWLCAVFMGCYLDYSNTWVAGILGALVYGMHSSHILPVAWVSAVNDSMLVLFSALTMGFTIRSFGNSRYAAYSALFLLLALLVKENAVVLLLFSLCLSAWRVQAFDSWYKTAKPVLILQGLVILFWLLYRHWLMIPVEDPTAYRFTVHTNIFRNTGSLLLFLLNMPREALRLLFLEQNILYALLGSIAVLLSTVVLVLILRESRRYLHRQQLLILFAMFICGIILFIPINWNCYAYYLSLALIPYTLLYVVVLSKIPWRLSFLSLSSLFVAAILSLYVSFAPGMPAIIARSFWVENNLAGIQSGIDGHRQWQRFYVKVHHTDTFTAIGGKYGLAYRLQIPVESIIMLPADVDGTEQYRPLLLVKKYQLSWLEQIEG